MPAHIDDPDFGIAQSTTSPTVLTINGGAAQQVHQVTISYE
jgi:hypothetical protein